MSNGKTELFVFLGAAFAVLIGLGVLQKWYGSYLDNRYHEHLAENGPAEGMVTARADDQAKLQQGKLPLDRAIGSLAQRGRTGFNSISPNPSQDLSALSGWIHRPGFKPVTAHPIRAPHPPTASGDTDEASDAAQPAQPAGTVAQPVQPAH